MKYTISILFQSEMESSEWLRNADIPTFAKIQSGHILGEDCLRGCDDCRHYNILETLREEVADEIRNSDN